MSQSTWESLRNQHRDSWAIVVGLGPSSSALPPMSMCLEITVNDGWKLRPHAEYAVVLDRPSPGLTKNKRHKTIIKGGGVTLMGSWGVKGWRVWIERMVKQGLNPWNTVRWFRQVIEFPFKLEKKGAKLRDWREGTIPGRFGSPFCACIVAAYMGAKRVGVIGVDRGEQHGQYKDLREYLQRTAGVDLVSLQRGLPLPYESPAEFAMKLQHAPP